jgi:uncharacterized membrane protein YdbT with pleckstrin-like domain
MSPDEQVFFHGHPSWRSMLAFHVKGFGLAVLAGAIAGIASAVADDKLHVLWVIAAVAAVFAVAILAGIARRAMTTYTITDQRLTIDHGLLSREVHETRLERVQNVNSSQSMFERLLRVGTVDFDTAGSADYGFAFRGVANPHRIVRTVDRALHELQRGQPHASEARPGDSIS